MRDLIRRTAVAAGATALVLGASAGAAAASTGTAIPTSHLYWANNQAGTIVEANLNGTSAHTIASGQAQPFGVAVNASHLYWANFNAGTIVEANLDGTGAKTIASSLFPAGRVRRSTVVGHFGHASWPRRPDMARSAWRGDCPLGCVMQPSWALPPPPGG